MPGLSHGAEIIPLLLTIFWLWMLVDCLKNKALTGTTKLFWVLLILFIHPIGAFIYLVFQRPRRHQQRQAPSYSYYQPSTRQQAEPSHNPTYTPPSRQKEEAPSSYERGYEMQRREGPASSENMEQSSVEQPRYDQYEQPQATYPEQAPQQSW